MLYLKHYIWTASPWSSGLCGLSVWKWISSPLLPRSVWVQINSFHDNPCLCLWATQGIVFVYSQAFSIRGAQDNVAREKGVRRERGAGGEKSGSIWRMEKKRNTIMQMVQASTAGVCVCCMRLCVCVCVSEGRLGLICHLIWTLKLHLTTSEAIWCIKGRWQETPWEFSWFSKSLRVKVTHIFKSKICF